MIDYIKAILPNIQSFSSSLSKKAIFLNHPWVLVNDKGENEKLIFQKDGELIMSKAGDVKTGKWEYLSQANSLLIDRGVDKKLYNQGFIDQGIMVLKLDGTIDGFIVLANENIIPNLDIKKYLKERTIAELDLRADFLSNGELIYIKKLDPNYPVAIAIGDKVYSNNLECINDGLYRIKGFNNSVNVINGKVDFFSFQKEYVLQEGTILIEQDNRYSISKGDLIIHSNFDLYDGIILTIKRERIIVKNSKVETYFVKNIFGKWIEEK
jgi:hypothetical protein